MLYGVRKNPCVRSRIELTSVNRFAKSIFRIVEVISGGFVVIRLEMKQCWKWKPLKRLG